MLIEDSVGVSVGANRFKGNGIGKIKNIGTSTSIIMRKSSFPVPSLS